MMRRIYFWFLLKNFLIKLKGEAMGLISDIKHNIHLSALVTKGRLKSRKLPRISSNNDFPIDFVVTWVNGNDPVWRAERDKYSKDVNEKGNGAERYREWNHFMYWFRAVEKYAPWVRKVFLITYGHIPEWLNTHYDKLVIVNHGDFIPKEYLPTFSSIPIELNIHRIKDLSEHFVYFCDDVYLSRMTSKEDFFVNGMPKYCSIAFPTFNGAYNGPFAHQLFGNIGLINGKFNIQSSIENNPELWFSCIYKDKIYYNKFAYKVAYLSGMYFSHLGCPYRKSTFEKVWAELSDKLCETCKHKFREYSDINHQVFSLWDILNGNFVPVDENYYGVKFGTLSKQINKISEAFLSGDNLMICLNDSIDINEYNFSEIKINLDNILECVFPEKSCFEK